MFARPVPLTTLLPRALLIVLALAAPVLAMPHLGRGGGPVTIEAPTMKKTGMGFVLLVSLQRN
ncbi:hypothetical protein [Oryzicola mucosus]|uniref:Uncharacterized protein n=1 Tax=Oryzicola mucosus TaxID=2767425 RepID=A0A8J6PX42_9HYPH|nr:hypothetical protein [Oryzicola mucosus]MBD0415868.1 hypothetical protein [Oryzicola mucosus]MDI6026483.1 hypothetical protein [Tianweitania sp. UT-5YL-CI-8]